MKLTKECIRNLLVQRSQLEPSWLGGSPGFLGTYAKVNKFDGLIHKGGKTYDPTNMQEIVPDDFDVQTNARGPISESYDDRYFEESYEADEMATKEK